MYFASRLIYTASRLMMHIFQPPFFTLILAWTALRPLVLQMISRTYIKLAMDSLKDEPQAQQVLVMPGEGEEVPPEIEVLRRSRREFLKICLIPSKDIDGRKPSQQQRDSYSKMMGVDVDANRIYGLNSQSLLFQLLGYSQMNGGFIPRVTQMRGHACSMH